MNEGKSALEEYGKKTGPLYMEAALKSMGHFYAMYTTTMGKRQWLVMSLDTMKEAIKIVRRHMSDHLLRAILDDLAKVEGNQGFKDAVAKMRKDLG